MSHTKQSTFIATPNDSERSLSATFENDETLVSITDPQQEARTIRLEEADAVAFARFILKNYGRSGAEPNGSSDYFRSGPGGP